jgi:uncharacterized secreted protein with C-terminal beta-propeller domain
MYATRFIGDRLSMVTFRRLDPFFVTVLSTPRDPEIRKNFINRPL